MDKLCLATTSLESTWDGSCRNLFLGESTRVFSRRREWGKHRPIMCEPPVVGLAERESQHVRICELKNSLLDSLSLTLNRLHNTSHSARYWNIILGHWLHRYISVLFLRYSYLKYALDNYPVTHAYVLANQDNYDLATNDSLGFIYAANDPVWNHFLYAKLLTKISGIQLFEVVLPFNSSSFEQLNANRFGWIKAGFLRLINAATNIFSKDSDPIITNTYLPKIVEVFLSLKMGQVPRSYKTPQVDVYKVSRHTRLRERNAIDVCGSEFESIASSFLLDMLPHCFLEGYPSLNNKASSLPWPTMPKFIFTSNRFDTDEIFKLWLADKVHKGCAYIVGQHGAGYGTHKYFQTALNPEVAESKKFITWGENRFSSNSFNGFIFKTAGQRRVNYSRLGGMLIVSPMMPYQVAHWDILSEFSNNQQFQFEFMDALPPSIAKMATIRLAPESAYTSWYDVERWREFSPLIKFDTNTSIYKSLKKNRLVVFFYDSTGILELFALNMPIIALWYGGLDHLLDDVKDDYQILVDAGIIHLHPISAGEWVKANWCSIDEWWNSVAVRNAVERFCDRYAKKCNTPVKTMSKLLNEIVELRN